MTTRALTLAIRLLSASAVGVALGSMPACWYCGDTGWHDPVTLDLGVDADLEAVISALGSEGDRSWSYLAAGSAGTVVGWGRDFSGDGKIFVEVFEVGSADLRALAVVDGAWWVVGDGGTAAVTGDEGETWTPVDLAGVTADLYGIAKAGVELVVVGDDVVVVRTADGTWTQAQPPAGGWGKLRAVHFDGERVFAVGLGGVVWSTDKPSTGPWAEEPTGVDVDLFDAGRVFLDLESTVVVGANGTLLVHDETGWRREGSAGVDADLIAIADEFVLDADGGVHQIGFEGGLSKVAQFEGARDVAGESWSGVTVVGDDGLAAKRENEICVGGRPFVVDGALRTAPLERDETWSRPIEGDAHGLPDELAATLAAAWARDGLYEHASVASFARFTLELLALGAPPDLIAQAQEGMADELDHARLCFDLARHFGGVPLGPGAMPIEPAALGRAGDPVATALALFDEGCLNESVAACEAAEAAAQCIHAPTRRVLEIIAADERRHATAAWAALRWLLTTHGDTVREPLRRRIARLGLARSPEADADFDPRLESLGRLSPARRAHVHARVVAELVRPLALAMLGGEPRVNAG